MKYIVLTILWSAWCFLHSALISLTVTEYIRHRFKGAFLYYRICYNGLSLVTLIPVVIYTYSIKSEPLFRWEGPFRVIQFILLLISLFLLLLGAIHYDTMQFLGIRQLRQSDSCALLTQNCKLDRRVYWA